MAFKFNPLTGQLDLVGSGSGGGNAFTIIQPDSGTSPTALTSNDTLTITSSGNVGFQVIGDSTTNTLSLSLTSDPVFSSLQTTGDIQAGGTLFASGADFGFGTVDNVGTLNANNSANLFGGFTTQNIATITRPGANPFLNIKTIDSTDIYAPELRLTRLRTSSANLQNGDTIGSLSYWGQANSVTNLLGNIKTFYTGNGTTYFGDLVTSVGTGSSTPTEITRIVGSTSTLQLTNQANIRFQDTGSKYVGVQAPTTVATSYTVKLPTAQGTGLLSNDGSGNLSWAAGSSAAWGSISGTLSSQTDLNTALGLKAPLASPTFTGSITTPITANRAVISNGSSVLAASATTDSELAFVSGVTSAIQTQLNAKAPTASPTFSGTVTTALSTGVVQSTSGVLSVANVNLASQVTSSLPVANNNSSLIRFFGDGSDGNVTISAGQTTLVRDMYYNNLTCTGGNLILNGYRIFVAGTLDITAATASNIHTNGGNGGAGSATGTAGTAGTAGVVTANSVGLSGAGGAGGTGSNTTGGAGGGGSGTSPQNGGANTQAGSNGLGGTGAGGAGGSRGAANSVTNFLIRYPTPELLKGISQINGGNGGSGGGAGGGTTSAAGGGGGGGGGAGGIVYIAAKIINRGGSTAASCISSVGGNGNSGGSASNANGGGGGGGAGGGGGWIYIIAGTLTGSTATNALDVTGGNGGAGGNGNGTGLGGNGHGSGGGGIITVFQLDNNSMTQTLGTGGSTGNAASGITGGATLTATASKANL